MKMFWRWMCLKPFSSFNKYLFIVDTQVNYQPEPSFRVIIYLEKIVCTTWYRNRRRLNHSCFVLKHLCYKETFALDRKIMEESRKRSHFFVKLKILSNWLGEMKSGWRESWVSIQSLFDCLKDFLVFLRAAPHNGRLFSSCLLPSGLISLGTGEAFKDRCFCPAQIYWIWILGQSMASGTCRLQGLLVRAGWVKSRCLELAGRGWTEPYCLSFLPWVLESLNLYLYIGIFLCRG